MGCPMCDKPSEKAFSPFCSQRCADLDLAKWISGSYTIASQDPDDAEFSASKVTKEDQNPRVGGSIPPPGTILRNITH